MFTKRYQPPELAEIVDLAENIRTLYQGGNPKRDTLSHFLAGLNVLSNKNKRVLLGGFVLALKSVEKNYAVFSAKKQTIFGYHIMGSEFVEILERKLKITSLNPLDDCSAVEYLAELYDFLKNHPADCEKLMDTCRNVWDSRDALIKSIFDFVSKVLRDQAKALADAAKIHLHGELLKTKLSNAAQSYRKLKKNNAEYKFLADLMDFVNLTCEMYGKSNQNNIDAINLFSLPDKLRKAVCLYVMAWIEKDYEGYSLLGWSPENSELYQSCQLALAIKHSTDYSVSERKQLFKSLADHFEPVRFAVIKQLPIYGEQASLIDDVQKHLSTINKKLSQQLAVLHSMNENEPLWFSEKVGANIKYLMEYGFNTAVTKTSSAYLVPDVGKEAIRSLGGAIGYLLFGPTGTLIGAYLADHVANSLVPVTFSGMCVSAVEPIGSRLGSLAGGIVSIPFYPIERGFRYFFSSDPGLRKKQEEYITHNESFLKALCKFPKEVFPRKEVFEAEFMNGDENREDKETVTMAFKP